MAALDRPIKLHYATLAVIVVVIGFRLPPTGPDRGPEGHVQGLARADPGGDHAKAWASRHGRHLAVCGLAIVAGLLVVRGVLGLLTRIG